MGTVIFNKKFLSGNLSGITVEDLTLKGYVEDFFDIRFDAINKKICRDLVTNAQFVYENVRWMK